MATELYSTCYVTCTNLWLGSESFILLLNASEQFFIHHSASFVCLLSSLALCFRSVLSSRRKSRLHEMHLLLFIFWPPVQGALALELESYKPVYTDLNFWNSLETSSVILRWRFNNTELLSTFQGSSTYILAQGSNVLPYASPHHQAAPPGIIKMARALTPEPMPCTEVRKDPLPGKSTPHWPWQ